MTELAERYESYQDYLDRWEALFGDEDEGDYSFFQYGREVPYRVRKLSQEEHTEHWDKYEQFDAEFYEAEDAGNDAGMQAALDKSFPYELRLLV